MAEMKERFKKISVISDDFEFLSGPPPLVTPVEILKKCTVNLAIEYDEDIGPRIINKIDVF